MKFSLRRRLNSVPAESLASRTLRLQERKQYLIHESISFFIKVNIFGYTKKVMRIILIYGDGIYTFLSRRVPRRRLCEDGIFTYGYSASKPKEENLTDKNRSANRRVEVVFFY